MCMPFGTKERIGGPFLEGETKIIQCRAPQPLTNCLTLGLLLNSLSLSQFPIYKMEIVTGPTS